DLRPVPAGDARLSRPTRWCTDGWVLRVPGDCGTRRLRACRPDGDATSLAPRSTRRVGPPGSDPLPVPAPRVGAGGDLGSADLARVLTPPDLHRAVSPYRDCGQSSRLSPVPAG